MSALSNIVAARTAVAASAVSRGVRKRESVMFNPGVFDYQIDLLQVSGDERLLLGRVRAKIHDVRTGYRLTVEGFGPRRRGDAPVHRLFFDNFGSPIATREEAGRLYQDLMRVAQAWLQQLAGVDDLDAVPALK